MVSIDGVEFTVNFKVSNRASSSGLAIRVGENVPYPEVTIHNTRPDDVEIKDLVVTHRNENGDELQPKRKHRAGRVRAGSSTTIVLGSTTVPSEWRGLECEAVAEVETKEGAQRIGAAQFKVEDVDTHTL